MNDALAELDTFLAGNIDLGLDVNFTGASILTGKATDQMATGQMRSPGVMLFVIFTVISLLFLNARAGVIALISNTFPVIVLFGAMGYMGIPLDTGPSIMAAIALGICVDNTMHFMVRYKCELNRQSNEAAAVEAALRGEAISVTASSLVLCLGLGTLGFSSFTPVAYFGLLSAMVVFLAYYANFLITPVLLTTTRLSAAWNFSPLGFRRHMLRNRVLFRDPQG